MIVQDSFELVEGSMYLTGVMLLDHQEGGGRRGKGQRRGTVLMHISGVDA